jgi:hypothetical protein
MPVEYKEEDGSSEEEDDYEEGEEASEEDQEDEDSDENDEDSDEDSGDSESGGEEEFEDEADEEKPMNNSDDPYEEYEPTKQSSTRLSERDEESWRERNMIPIIVCICCCLCLIIIAIILALVLPGTLDKKSDEDSFNNDPATTTINRPTDPPNPAPFNPVSFPTPPPAELPPSARPPPTPFPTISPAPSAAPFVEPTSKPSDSPTASPSVSPAPTKSVPNQVGIVADQDTTVYLDGFYVVSLCLCVSGEMLYFLKFSDTSLVILQGDSYGSDVSFLVQHGDDAFNEIPDAVALITFPLTDVPSYDRLVSTKKNAILRLFHETTDPERGSATYTVVRLPGTKMDVEQFHGYIFKVPEDDAKGIVVGPEFTVNPDTTVVDVDVTSLLFDGEEDEHDQLFIMLQDRGPEQPEGGDRFYSREHPEFKPLLLIDFQGGSAADIYVDTTTPPPTPLPSNTSGGNTGGDGETGEGVGSEEGESSESGNSGNGEQGGPDAELAPSPVPQEGDPNAGEGEDVELAPSPVPQEDGPTAGEGEDVELAPSTVPQEADPNADVGEGTALDATPDPREEDPVSGAELETPPAVEEDPEAGAVLETQPPRDGGEIEGNVRRRRG